ncbi:unnamed protein product [Phytophthora fragariaefolia]|uniref:Unnamed protein product n=1 Tax=Phytophthora fragariaefolia TaxID=1490495 RepID=A0A9W6XRF6_9STRA|nr:unnamed protein product [Phytophthora fragariaefolia]
MKIDRFTLRCTQSDRNGLGPTVNPPPRSGGARLVEISAWKESDKVEYTRFGNPRMPSVDTVCGWVLRARRDTEEATVMNSVEAAGFANEPTDWFIAKQDVYGSRFRERWGDESKEDDDTDTVNWSVLDDALDDINLVDE